MTWRAGGDGRPVAFPHVPWHEDENGREQDHGREDREGFRPRYPDLGQHDDITQERLDDPEP